MINRDTTRQKSFTRRALLLGAGKLALFTVLGGRLIWLQVAQQEKYKTLSDKNRISMRLVPAGRGEIFDRFGVPLAINVQNFRAFIVAEQARDVERVLESLSKLIPVTPRDKEQTLEDIKKHKSFTPVLVKENLTWDDMARVEVHIPELPGVMTDTGQTRSYPLSTATSHAIGYVGPVSEAELTDDPVMRIPGFRIGKNGLEKTYDDVLRGGAGQVQAEVNAVGREIRELSRMPAQKGARLTLTLDADLQMQCQDMLAREKSASAVVMDAHSGEVYVLCSHPGFDPHLFSRGIAADAWEELLSSDAHPLLNKAITGVYPPASTFKMVTALAALENGISSNRKVYCPGHYILGRGKFHCWKGGGHGWVDVIQALEQSCDVFFYEIAYKIGIEAIADMARRLGLGSKTGINIPGELSGLVPDKAWKKRIRKESWQAGETLNVSIGQGAMQTTPLQLTVMTARLVNGGKAVRPGLVRSVGDVHIENEKWEDLGLNPYHLTLVRRGMNAVVNRKKGTAFGSRIQEDGYSMAGKTGTAQVRRITAEMRAQGVKNEDLPWKQRHHALFVAYAPVKKPKYVATVVVDHGVGGSRAAAPIARDLLLATLKRDPRSKKTVDSNEG